MHRIINKEIIPRIIEAIKLSEHVLSEHPELAEEYAIWSSFNGVSQQIDSFLEPIGLIWYLKGYDSKLNIPICETIPVNTKKYEYVKVRKDILDKLYASIDDVIDSLHNGKDIAFGNVMEARDELEGGKTYEEIKENMKLQGES